MTRYLRWGLYFLLVPILLKDWLKDFLVDAFLDGRVFGFISWVLWGREPQSVCFRKSESDFIN